MKHRLFALLLSGLALCLCPNAAAQDDTQVLTELLHNFLQGASTNDTEAHDRFWSDELIYTSSSGLRFGKAEIMASLAASPPVNDSESAPTYSAESITIRVLEDTALLTFELVASQADGETERFYNSGVFRRAGNEWRVLLWQATRKQHD